MVQKFVFALVFGQYCCSTGQLNIAIEQGNLVTLPVSPGDDLFDGGDL